MKNLLWGLILLLGCGVADQGIPVIIDADTANEVDDLYAIVRALVAPELDVKGITSAQFHISPLASDSTVRESQDINEQIVKLMGREDVPVIMGSNMPMTKEGVAAESPAVDFIIEEARKYTPGNPLNLVILGSCTNVASAILKSPEIIPNVSVHYIGFWHEPETNYYNIKEFNSGNDTLAVNTLLNTPGLDFNVMSATTCQRLVFDKSNADRHLSGQDGIKGYLLERWNTYKRWWTKEDPEQQKWIMWDVAIIEALIHPEWASKRSFTTPPDNVQREIEIYIDINVEEMKADFWKTIDDLD